MLTGPTNNIPVTDPQGDRQVAKPPSVPLNLAGIFEVRKRRKPEAYDLTPELPLSADSGRWLRQPGSARPFGCGAVNFRHQRSALSMAGAVWFARPASPRRLPSNPEPSSQMLRSTRPG